MFHGPFDESIIKRAQKEGKVTIKLHNLRDWARDSYGTVDGKPFGGGPGMILRVDVVASALENLRVSNTSEVKHLSAKRKQKGGFSSEVGPRLERTILLSPQGKLFDQKKAYELSKLDRLILICGHYEGFDARIREHLVDEELSIGNYILTGGELPAMVVVDATTRLLPGVIKKGSLKEETFSNTSEVRHLKPNKLGGRSSEVNLKRDNLSLSEPPQYTAPREYKGWKVPEVLLSGNHEEIKKWREANRLSLSR